MPMELGGPRCAKYTLYAVNILIIILACVTLGVGIWLSSNVSGFITALNPNLDPTSGEASSTLKNSMAGGVGSIQTVANVLITAGVFALLIGFLGFWAAYKDSKGLLITYGVILILVILLELGAGIAFGVDKPSIVRVVAKDFARAIDKYEYVPTTVDSGSHIVVVKYDQPHDNASAEATLMINVLQTWIGCCGGLFGYKDFQNSPYWHKANGQAPVFCCKLTDTTTLRLEDPTCTRQRTPDNSWMNTGCANKTAAIINRNMPTIIGVSVGIGIVNILGVVAAFYLYYTITHGYREF